MKHKIFKLSPQLVYVALASISSYLYLGIASAKCASAEPSGSLDAQVSLVTSSTLTVGEPVVLYYRLSNTSPSKQLTFNAGEHRRGWYSLSLTNENGQKVTATANVPFGDQHRKQGLYQPQEISILPSAYVEGDCVVTQALGIAQPGKYTLNFHIPIIYYMEPKGAWYPEGRPANQKPFSLMRDYSFSLVVMEANPERLQATAKKLCHELQDVKLLGKSQALLAALSSLPEDIALPNWQNLILDPATPPAVLNEAVVLLGELRSPGAAELLGQVIFDRPPATGTNEDLVRMGAHRALTEMYNAGDAQLRQKMKQVFISHGASTADLLEIVTVSNPN